MRSFVLVSCLVSCSLSASVCNLVSSDGPISPHLPNPSTPPSQDNVVVCEYLTASASDVGPRWTAARVTKETVSQPNRREYEEAFTSLDLDIFGPDRVRLSEESYEAPYVAGGLLAPWLFGAGKEVIAAVNVFELSVLPIHHGIHWDLMLRINRFVETLIKDGPWEEYFLLSGPLFIEENQMSSGIPIPSHIFSIVMARGGARPDASLAFIIPNKPEETHRSLHHFLTYGISSNWDVIQAATGFDISPYMCAGNLKDRISDKWQSFDYLGAARRLGAFALDNIKTFEELKVFYFKAIKQGLHVAMRRQIVATVNKLNERGEKYPEQWFTGRKFRNVPARYQSFMQYSGLLNLYDETPSIDIENTRYLAWGGITTDTVQSAPSDMPVTVSENAGDSSNCPCCLVGNLKCEPEEPPPGWRRLRQRHSSLSLSLT